ncbi:MAG: orotidine-5'-phosphate decarboxylase [Candidatus Eremiobacteraeota bacterium]|nr:orotidine-5'-phosphate decarboxylase [Candidatus Eremiobacteraeota bacterium]
MSQLIVALDLESASAAETLLDRLVEFDLFFKIGYQALYGYGEQVLHSLQERDVRFFLDAKLHDIPHTVGAAVRALVRPGARIINVHALGGLEMMRAAVDAGQERAAELGLTAPLIFAVTILTSIASEDLAELGLSGGPAENAIRLAALARDAGCSGVVCSPHEVADLKNFFGTEFLTLTPGIRPSGASHGDQKRVMTPAQACAAGADYLVVGRPITAAIDPAQATRDILAQMQPH